MNAFFFVWCIGASAILFWCSVIANEADRRQMRDDGLAKTNLDYIVISPALLSEWEERQSDLVIIDLRDRINIDDDRAIPGSLNIPPPALTTELDWLPSATRLVFYHSQGIIDHFDWKVENALLAIGIDVVYVLDGGFAAWQALLAQRGGRLHRRPALAGVIVASYTERRNSFRIRL